MSVVVVLGAACQTTGPNGGTLISISTDPAGALVKVESYGECETPCTVELSSPRRAVLAKAGFRKEQILLNPQRRKVHIPLTLSAPTEQVQTDTLPDLD